MKKVLRAWLRWFGRPVTLIGAWVVLLLCGPFVSDFMHDNFVAVPNGPLWPAVVFAILIGLVIPSVIFASTIFMEP